MLLLPAVMMSRVYIHGKMIFFVHSAFPLPRSVTHENDKVEVKNFLGEKRVRTIKVPKLVTFDRSKDVKDELVLSGTSETFFIAAFLFNVQIWFQRRFSVRVAEIILFVVP